VIILCLLGLVALGISLFADIGVLVLVLVLFLVFLVICSSVWLCLSTSCVSFAGWLVVGVLLDSVDPCSTVVVVVVVVGVVGVVVVVVISGGVWGEEEFFSWVFLFLPVMVCTLSKGVKYNNNTLFTHLALCVVRLLL
jgi:hypothetical protein